MLNEQISTRIAALPRLNRLQLSTLWQEEFGKEMPPHLRKSLIVSVLAYRIQEKEYGGLSHAARRRLREIAASIGSDKETLASIGKTVSPGTRLVRSWHGEMHEVRVTERALEYRGQCYRTLSSIARKITGTQWSGPAFFGVSDSIS